MMDLLIFSKHLLVVVVYIFKLSAGITCMDLQSCLYN